MYFLKKFLKRKKIMATFTDLQNATAALTTAAETVESAIKTFQTAQAGAITSAEADTLVQSITAATTSLEALATSLAPAATTN